MNRLRDMRAFIDALENAGDLQGIDEEVDWNLEIGAVIRRCYDLQAPAPLFNRITGIEPGFRALGAPGGLTALPGRRFARVALALGLPADASGEQLVETLAAAMDRTPIPPRVVDAADAPCKQNVLLGDDVDLLRFPSPLLHYGDGGRYLQTYGLNLVTTPDGSWTNASVNRMMLVDRTRLACLIPPVQHLGVIHAMWRERGEPTPVVVALGVEPALPYVGGMPLDRGVSELDYMGAYFGEPIDVVPAETVDLLVPATAEIVVEGRISHHDTHMEGPMGEFPGYLPEPEGSPKPVLHVSAISFRNDPILPVAVAGPPVEEDHTGWGIPHAADCLHRLRRAGIPVSTCWMVPESACHWLVVAMEPDWHDTLGISAREVAEKVGNIVFEAKAGFGLPRLILLEHDIDVSDLAQLVWAFASRAHPSESDIFFRDESFANLAVFLSSDEKFTYHVTKVVQNCLLGDRYPDGPRPLAGSFANAWPAEIQQRVLTRWREYGYR